MAIYGYARVSTLHQNLDRQIDNIMRSCDALDKIYCEKFTGTTTNRPELEKLLKRVKPGDTIVFDSVSRMSRDAAEGVALYERLYSQGVDIRFLKEPHINTQMYRQALSRQLELTGNNIADTFIEATNKVLLILAKQQVEMAFHAAEKEVVEKRTCIKEGIRKVQEANARYDALGEPERKKQIGLAKGTKLTTKKSLAAKEVIKTHSKDFGGTLSDPECIKLAGISRNSFYLYKRQLREKA